jgi:hypothetical protein
MNSASVAPIESESESQMSTMTQQTVEQSEILFGGAANSYYADPERRQIATRIELNAHGEYIARLFPARRLTIDGEVHIVASSSCSTSFSSPIFTVEADAIDWCELASSWAVENMTGQLSSPKPPFVTESHSLCPKCDRFDTLSTQQLAYGDETTCSACDYSSYYSIGD